MLRAAAVTFDAVAGGETAGIPYAAYLARDLDLPMLYVRKKAKGYGMASKVEGRLEPGWRVLLVEDLVTDGGSKLGFVDALRAGSAAVDDALVLFDRQQGGERVLAEHGVRLHSVTDLATTLAVGEAATVLPTEARAEVDRYLADPPPGTRSGASSTADRWGGRKAVGVGPEATSRRAPARLGEAAGWTAMSDEAG